MSAPRGRRRGWRPLPAAREAPPEGAVGAGTGMTCLGFKGGIGSASRLVPSGHTVGVLVLTNFGDQERLTVDGVPVGRLLPVATETAGRREHRRPPAGSCITVVVTDGPLDSAACTRLARRAGLGLARTGSTGHHGSGEIFLALATGLRAPRGEISDLVSTQISGRGLDPFFAAVVEATEEAVLTSMLMAPAVTGRDGNTSPALPAARVRQLLSEAGRISGSRSGPESRPGRRRGQLSVSVRAAATGRSERAAPSGGQGTARLSGHRRLRLDARPRVAGPARVPGRGAGVLRRADGAGWLR